MDEQFDPEKVDRWEPQWDYDFAGMGIDPDGGFVAVEDYDKLLQVHIQTLIDFNACTLKLAAMKG